MYELAKRPRSLFCRRSGPSTGGAALALTHWASRSVYSGSRAPRSCYRKSGCPEAAKTRGAR